MIDVGDNFMYDGAFIPLIFCLPKEMKKSAIERLANVIIESVALS